jgi:asparagine synthetase B (glutamine-hydrolysing)
MSFIAGVIGPFSQTEVGAIVERMAKAMAYRGGNANQIISSQDNTFNKAMTGSHCYPDAAARIFLAMDGEIYAIPGNDNLTQDTGLPTLARQYQQTGSEFPRSVNGAYTAALWDDDKKALHLSSRFPR